MRYRKLDANDDYSFGHGQNDFYVNEKEAPAQAIKTRLRMFLEEYWVDISQGTPWKQKIYGKTPIGQRDSELQARILGTQDVQQIDSFVSSQTADRQYTVQADVDTVYGNVSISETV